MGGTFRRARKTFGVKKTSNHFSRSNWSHRNEGVRLRSLLADIEDFKEIAGEDAPILHGSGIPAPKPIAIPSISKKKNKEKSRPKSSDVVVIKVEEEAEPIELVVLSHHHKRPILPTHVVTKSEKEKNKVSPRTAFLESLSDKDLESRKEYSSRQSSYLTLLIKSLTHNSYASAVTQLRSRKRYWDSMAGSVGRILWDRKNVK